jgi:hypothetical protein
VLRHSGTVGAWAYWSRRAGLVRPCGSKNALVTHHALHDREQMIDEDIDRRVGPGRALAKEKIIVGEASLQQVTTGSARSMEEIGIATLVVERQLRDTSDPGGADIPDIRRHGAALPVVLDRGRDRASATAAPSVISIDVPDLTWACGCAGGEGGSTSERAGAPLGIGGLPEGLEAYRDLPCRELGISTASQRPEMVKTAARRPVKG